MKKISALFIVMIALFATSCKEPVPPIPDPETGNKAPICYFSTPSNGSSHYSTSEVKLQIEAFDEDGEVVSVEIHFDNSLYQTLYYAPYTLIIPADYFTEGQHVIKAVAKDNDNATKIATITIYIVLGNGGSTIYSIGSLYNQNGLKGIIYKLSNDGTSGMIVSLSDTLCDWAWSEYQISTGAADVNNGAFNLSKILESGQIRKHPAFNWCNKINTNNVNGWYLPAKNQVRDIYNSLDVINENMSLYGVPFFKPEHENDTIYLWSSTEESQTTAWSVNLRNGNSSNPNKYWHAYVRAVHPF